MIGLAETDTHGEEGGRCFKDGSVGLAASHGLGGCKTSIKRKWAKGGGEVKWKRKRWEDGRKGEGKLIFKRVFPDTPQGAKMSNLFFRGGILPLAVVK